MNTSQIQQSPATSRTVIESGIRYTVLGRTATDRRLRPRIKFKLCNPAQAAAVLEELRAWQKDSPLCPVVDAVVVTRTVTYSAWTEQPKQADSPDPDAAYKEAIEADLPGGAA
ncbi:hypothetical protein ACQEVF_25060 [Nonomuraea polychroma]|uniref:hypothetical protein n=1 Tax=Nonomuraea polychroma TaxID=46176 RepID=UPI003D8A9227